MAYIVIQHLDPNRPSMLASVLASDVRMPVVEVADGMRAAPNRVHVIPPGADLGIGQGILTLLPRQHTRKLHLPIDSFSVRSRTTKRQEPSVSCCRGPPPTAPRGFGQSKAAGGITFVQDPNSHSSAACPRAPSRPASPTSACLPRKSRASSGDSALIRISRGAKTVDASAEADRPGDEASLSGVPGPFVNTLT